MGNSEQRQFLQRIGRRRRPHRRESFPTAACSVPYRRRCRRRSIRCKNCRCPEFPPFTLLKRSVGNPCRNAFNTGGWIRPPTHRKRPSAPPPRRGKMPSCWAGQRDSVHARNEFARDAAGERVARAPVQNNGSLHLRPGDPHRDDLLFHCIWNSCL